MNKHAYYVNIHRFLFLQLQPDVLPHYWDNFQVMIKFPAFITN